MFIPHQKKITLDQISTLKTQAIEKLAKLKSHYDQLSVEEKYRLVEFESLLLELEGLKKNSEDAAKKRILFPSRPDDASIDMEKLAEDAKNAIHQEHYAHWLTLDKSISVAFEILIEKETKDTVIKDDIRLLKKSVQFTRSIVQNRDDFDEDGLTKISEEITNRITSYKSFYKKNSLMPNVWGGLLIGLGVLTIAVALAAECAIIVATLGVGVIPAVGVALGGGLAGAALISIGLGYMQNKTTKLQIHRPIVTENITKSVHTLHSKQKHRDEQITKFEEAIKPKKK